MIKKDISNMGKDLERARYEVVIDRDTLASTESKAHRLVSKIDRVR